MQLKKLNNSAALLRIGDALFYIIVGELHKVSLPLNGLDLILQHCFHLEIEVPQMFPSN